MSAAPRVIPPGDGDAITFPFGQPRIKVGRGDGLDQVGLIESELPPGGGFQLPHRHDDLDETFYVLDGAIDYLLDDTWIRAEAGTTVFVPAGVVHAFRNSTDRTARQIVVGTPEAIELVKELGRHPREQWGEVFAAYRTRAVRGREFADA
jgi:uncharacterized cupin superfamily protein